jgi:hypothetical protein
LPRLIPKSRPKATSDKFLRAIRDIPAYDPNAMRPLAYKGQFFPADSGIVKNNRASFETPPPLEERTVTSLASPGAA